MDILTLSETHLTDSDCNKDELYIVSGYKFVRRDRIAGFGGGVAMYIKKTVNLEKDIRLGTRHFGKTLGRNYQKQRKKFFMLLSIAHLLVRSISAKGFY